jgi:hypothetical protein
LKERREKERDTERERDGESKAKVDIRGRRSVESRSSQTRYWKMEKHTERP